MAKYIAQVRTNIRFDVNNGNELVPTIELVILTYSPDYTIDKTGKVVKHRGLAEQRMEMNGDQLNDLIAQLADIAEVFLPYAITKNGTTVWKEVQGNGMLMLQPAN